MGNTIKPMKVASAMDVATDTWPKEDTPVLRIPGYQILRDPAGVRCLIETAIDQRVEKLGPLTPDPSPPAS
jgi:hypothetical protein